MKTIITALLILASLPAIARDPRQVREFRRHHPCPSTGKIRGACPNWIVNHVKPLCAAGLDAPSNMAWQDRKESYKSDAEERRYCRGLKWTK